MEKDIYSMTTASSKNDEVTWTAYLTLAEYEFVNNIFDGSNKSRKELFKLMSLYFIATIDHFSEN